MQEKNMGHICPIGRSGVKVAPRKIQHDMQLQLISQKEHVFAHCRTHYRKYGISHKRQLVTGNK